MASSSRTILITGSSRGIGLGLVREYLKRGHRVVATSRNHSSSLQEIVHPHLRWLPLDVTRQESVMAVRDAMANCEVDIVINNAGISTAHHPSDQPLQTQADEFMQVMRTNCLGPLLVSQALFPLLRQHGVIVNISSSLGSVGNNTWGDSTSYRASKAALNMVTRNLALQAQAESTPCTIVALDPGWVETEMGCSSDRQPPLRVEESARCVANVIDSLNPQHSGGFFDHKGQPIPW